MIRQNRLLLQHVWFQVSLPHLLHQFHQLTFAKKELDQLDILVHKWVNVTEQFAGFLQLHKHYRLCEPVRLSAALKHSLNVVYQTLLYCMKLMHSMSVSRYHGLKFHAFVSNRVTCLSVASVIVISLRLLPMRMSLTITVVYIAIQPRWVVISIIPRSHSYCLSLSLCLKWYNWSITPRVHSGVTKPAQC